LILASATGAPRAFHADTLAICTEGLGGDGTLQDMKADLNLMLADTALSETLNLFASTVCPSKHDDDNDDGGGGDDDDPHEVHIFPVAQALHAARTGAQMGCSG
jgi:hypothetical protein